ncbi:MAG: hypothetical protein IPM36_22285 [Lewinellaceae bacterium]|nr:hypothetical protein [Lewinellaceae bacterium]
MAKQPDPVLNPLDELRRQDTSSSNCAGIANDYYEPQMKLRVAFQELDFTPSSY